MTTLDTPAPRSSIDPAAAALVVFLCLLWALNQVGIKVANDGMQPALQAGIRSFCGAVLVFAWCLVRGVPLFERDGTLRAGIAVGLLFGLEFVLLYVGMDYTNVSRAVIFIYTAPIVVAVGAHFLIPGEHLTAVRLSGLVMAFLGVVLAFSDELSLPSASALLGDALCLAAGIAWGGTILVIKTTRLARASAEKVLLYQLAVSALPMLLAAPLFGPLIRDFTPFTAGAVAFQVVVVVVASYLVWFWLLRHYPASRLSAFTFLTPVFAVILGGLLLGEALSAKLILALVLVGVGIALVNRPST
jgi:drug/metabolite transporter (DMT)-like permease